MSVATTMSGARRRRTPQEVPIKTKPSRWLLGALELVLVGGIGAGVLARYWPYAESHVVAGLQDTFKTTVTVERFRRFYFPHPGCELEIVRLARPTNIGRERPLATVQKIRITGRYSDLLFQPYHVAEIEVNGLRVRIPAPGEPKNWNQGTKESTSSKVSVDTVITNGAVLEIEKEKVGPPLKFEIYKLRLNSVAEHKPINYDVRMGIPEPPGELKSQGQFGPWEDGVIDKMPLSGRVELITATLNKYPGLGGTIRSQERFGGTLEQVEVTGEASAPDFELVSAGHKVELRTQFDVTVNTIKGEAQLTGVVARVGKTTIYARGEVTKHAKSDHREGLVDLSIPSGRAEDLLWVFSGASKPAMVGTALCSGHVRVRKFGKGFLDALEANGKFEVEDGHFQKAMQVKTNVLSARAQGKKIKAADVPEVAVENLSSEVKIQNGVAHLTSTYFQVPGARARVEGTYKLENSQVDLHGNLWTDASLSDNTTGIKTILLEPFDPLFRRKHAGAMLGVSMTGDIHAPRIGTVLTKKKASWGSQQNSKKASH